MTIKEIIVDKLRAAGYDFLTACEITNKTLREFLDSNEQSRTFHVMSGTRVVDTFEIARKKTLQCK